MVAVTSHPSKQERPLQCVPPGPNNKGWLTAFVAPAQLSGTQRSAKLVSGSRAACCDSTSRSKRCAVAAAQLALPSPPTCLASWLALPALPGSGAPAAAQWAGDDSGLF